MPAITITYRAILIMAIANIFENLVVETVCSHLRKTAHKGPQHEYIVYTRPQDI